MRRLGIIVAAGAVTAVLFGWFLVVKLPNWFRPTAAVVPAPAATGDVAVRKIRARLFYVSEDGMRLVGVERDVPFGETPPQQAQALIEEQLKPAPAPLLAPLPASTSLRSVFVTQTGEAYVDLSKDAVTAHTGGSLDELFSVYAIVNTLTVNLPAITRVQILVDGKETDSLAGHIDLRGPCRGATAGRLRQRRQTRRPSPRLRILLCLRRRQQRRRPPLHRNRRLRVPRRGSRRSPRRLKARRRPDRRHDDGLRGLEQELPIG